jgi:predicted AlkP superfamily pyrophosphatase or phosphodiesterase
LKPEGSGAHPHFVLPRYGGYSFAEIPASVLSLLGVETGRPLLAAEVLAPVRERRFDRILLILIDGLGFESWERAARHPFFSRIPERGQLTPLTAVFPSTTSASLTTLCTGLMPIEHGLPEWNIYLEEVDEVIVSLAFKRWNAKYNDELLDIGLEARVLFEGPTIFELLAEQGIPSVTFTRNEYARSAYSSHSLRGSTSCGFMGQADFVVRLADELRRAPAPSLIYAYWDGFDALGHTYSQPGRECDVELENISRIFLEQLPALSGRDTLERTLLLVTADHGQVEVIPERTIYITDHPELVAALRTKGDGKPLLPTGGMRDLFLHVKPERLASTKQLLEELLAGKAEVWYSADAIAGGLFGTAPASPRFGARAGDLIVLPYASETVWAEYPGKSRPHHMRGHHGGLTAAEMFIPFGAVMFSEIL